MESIYIVELALAAMMVGALLPVLFQLRSTLKAAQKFFELASPRLEQSLREVAGAAERVEQLGAKVEQLTGTIGVAAKLGAAVGPAFAAAVHAFRAQHKESAEAEAKPQGGV